VTVTCDSPLFVPILAFEVLRQQLVDDARIGPAFRFFHDLADEEADGFLLARL
jgi:hypothetical protein